MLTTVQNSFWKLILIHGTVDVAQSQHIFTLHWSHSQEKCAEIHETIMLLQKIFRTIGQWWFLRKGIANEKAHIILQLAQQMQKLVDYFAKKTSHKFFFEANTVRMKNNQKRKCFLKEFSLFSYICFCTIFSTFRWNSPISVKLKAFSMSK